MQLFKTWKALVLGLALASASVALAVQSGTSISTGTGTGTVHTAMRGPCQPLTVSIPTPPACATTCVIACTDPCATITATSGRCLGTDTTGCIEFSVTINSKICRDCACIWSLGTCRDDGTYYSGTRKLKDCAVSTISVGEI